MLSAKTARMLADRYERARRLAKAIKDAGFGTVGDAAERHHFKGSTLTSHANGTRAFDLETGYEYARKFKVDPVWLLGLRDFAAEPRIPTDHDLLIMVNSAAEEVPPGSSIAEWKRTVASSLRDQLERYQADDGFLHTSDAGSARDTAAQPLVPTK